MLDALKLAKRTSSQQRTLIDFGGCVIGDGSLAVMAGPCSVESSQQIQAIAQAVKQAGGTFLRGGAFKPRSSPYTFQGLGEPALKYLREAADQQGLLCVSEVVCSEDVPLVARYVDILQVGSRNMQNTHLLKCVGQQNKPVLLKRGMSATYQEFLLAAEYILREGNSRVILCERGIRTFETHSRNTLDLAAIPLLRALTHLPIIIDPSHGTGHRHAVPAMSRAAVAAGADGLIIETHTTPDQSVSDAQQTISTETFSQLMPQLTALHGLLMETLFEEA